jgi:hypothetical protein
VEVAGQPPNKAEREHKHDQKNKRANETWGDDESDREEVFEDTQLVAWSTAIVGGVPIENALPKDTLRARWRNMIWKRSVSLGARL